MRSTTIHIGTSHSASVPSIRAGPHHARMHQTCCPDAVAGRRQIASGTSISKGRKPTPLVTMPSAIATQLAAYQIQAGPSRK